MATTLYLLDTVADTHLGTDNANFRSPTPGNVGWTSRALGTARGSGVVASDAVATITSTGILDNVVLTKGTFAVEWISPPVAADVTISGTLTANIWAAESNMSANVAAGVALSVIRANATATRNSNTIADIVAAINAWQATAEMAVTTRAVNNFTKGSYGSHTINRGDRIRIVLYGAPVGTMAATYTFNASWNGTSAAADGDSYVTFAETITFESAPAGSVVYLTDTASAVSTASMDLEAWTSRGSGVLEYVTNSVAGWTAPIHMTNTGGGTVVDWFTRPLTAFTLSGMAVGNIRARCGSTATNGSVRCEIARVEGDGTSPTVWANWCIAPIGTDSGEPNATEQVRTVYVSGNDLAITNGQRLRIRFYADDSSSVQMGSSGGVRLFVNGTSGGASGDSYITFPQTLTEYSSAPGPSQMYRFVRANRFLTSR